MKATGDLTGKRVGRWTEADFVDRHELTAGGSLLDVLAAASARVE